MAKMKSFKKLMFKKVGIIAIIKMETILLYFNQISTKIQSTNI